MRGHPTLRRKLRRDIHRTLPLFLALTVTVMLGIALYAAANNAYVNLTASYDNAFVTQRFPDLFVTTPDPGAYKDGVATAPGVAAVRTRVQADLPMAVAGTNSTSTKLVGRVVGYPDSGAPDVAALTILSGASNPSTGTVLVEEHLADTFGLTEGDTLMLTTATGDQQVTVAGIVNSAEYLWPAPSRQDVFVPADSFGVVYATDADARTWSGAGDNQALVLLTDSARNASDAATTLDQLSQQAVAAGATQVLTRAEQPSNSVLQEDISGFQQMATAFPVLFLTAAGLAMYVLLTRRVAQERQIIGTLRACGVRGRTIGWHYLSYGLAAGVIGAFVGLPLGTLMAGAMTRVYLGVIGLPEQLAVYAGFRIETLAVGLAFALVATAIAGGFPALRAARIAPAEAMRGDVPAGQGRTSRVEWLVPGMRHVSARWRMIVRSIARNGRRSVFTAAGAVLALILVLASVGMLDTMTHLMSVQFQQVTTSDAAVQYAQPVGPEQVDQVSAVSGVVAAESVISLPVSIRSKDAVYATTLTAFDADTRMHGFITSQGEPVPMPADGILVDESISAQLPDLAPGDSVDLTFPDLGTTVTATVAGFTYEPLGTFAYSSKDWLTSQVPQAVPLSIQARFADGADQAALQEALSALPGVVSYFATSSLQSTFDQYSGLFYVFVGAMLVLGAAMAFAIIFTTMSVNIVERQRELATFRAAGVRYRTIAGLVGGENVIVVALGVIPGLVLGLITADAMLQTYSSDQFTLTLYINPVTLVLSALAVLAVAVLSQWPGMRAIRRMNVADVVRERS
ncbi:MAG: FtsX-like permease family protein [Actinomycetales bacterium]|nr:FtsX-like permease family protein [Actinomycetales bacterium]